MSEVESGWIELILGPMFSGKTTELLRRTRRYSLAGKKCVIIKYVKDDRYSKEECCTHDKMKAEAVAAGLLREVEDIESYDVIGIDEGQFFPDIVEFCEEQANKGKGVLVSALDGTFMRSPFGRILELVPLAESVTKLSAICMLCHKDAAFSKRLGAEKEVEVIGGSDKYIAVCRKCYFKNIDRSKQITEFFKPTVEEREVKVVEDK